MLRIKVHQDDTICRLELAGRLAGLWVAETENVWRSAPPSAKQIEVDVREVTDFDAAGRELLTAMHQAGVRLIAEGVEMTALLEEITGKTVFHSGVQITQVKNSTNRANRRSEVRRNSA